DHDIMKRFLLATLGVALALALASRADADSPFDPNFQDAGPILVDDDVMPSRAEVETTAAWIRRAFGAEKDAAATSDAPLIVVERQDYSRLRFGETCVGDRFVVGGRAFEKGLGTHADSRLRVLCPKPVAKFDATIGLATANGQGSVRYALEVEGKTIATSDVARGGDAPREFHAVFDPPANEFTLIVDRADDGPNCDQANWLEPIATTTDGKIFDLATDAVVERIRPETPFSFKLDGVSSREFLNKWRFNAVRESPLVDLFVWSDPETKLEIRARVRRFEKFAAAEWLLEFVNAGENDSPILSEIQALDAAFDYGFEREACVVHSLSGDSCDENSWIPKSTAVPPGGAIEVAPRGGRSSNGAFPFWNVVSRRTGETERAEGFFIAIGWSGQWRATFENLAQAQPTIVAKAGLESISTILHPNESIRSPRILVMPWRGCLESAQVLFRRLLMFEYAPKIDGKPVKLGIVSQCFA
ncbi:MAG: NPCBM/NEW2 domain-containing protein, partial [Thermoguttaceae bacterium]|nr:NPCBM/NEW2 domain-containing protein [Thermoguttaceae bacterium]